jgi:hypothetical protein
MQSCMRNGRLQGSLWVCPGVCVCVCVCVCVGVDAQLRVDWTVLCETRNYSSKPGKAQDRRQREVLAFGTHHVLRGLTSRRVVCNDALNGLEVVLGR